MLKRTFVALLTILSIVGATAMLTACNTMEGAGQDIQRAGGALENKANENK
jgi:predicted small secreted protein